MLATIAFLLACVTGIASDYTTPYYKPPTDAYPAYPQTSDYGLSSSIEQEIQRLDERLQAAYASDEELANYVIDTTERRRANTQLTDTFLVEVLRDLRQRQANQSDEISKLERQAEPLILLIDEVTVLNSTLGELSRQARQLVEESMAIEGEAYLLSKDDKQQERRLAAVKARLAEQQRKLDGLDKASLELRDKLNSNRDLTENVTRVVDREQGEQAVVILTKENPRATRLLEEDFSEFRPELLFGFSSIHITDESNSYVLPDNYGGKGYEGKGYGGKGYGGKGYEGKGYEGKGYEGKGYEGKGYGRYQSNYGNASINFVVDATYNVKTNEITIFMVDSSTGGWAVKEVTATVTAISIDKGIYQIESEKSEKYY